MARVTVEDCTVHVPNRFKLIVLAIQRARQLGNSKPKIPKDGNTNMVIALREIAEQAVDLDQLVKDYKTSSVKDVSQDDPRPERL